VLRTLLNINWVLILAADPRLRFRQTQLHLESHTPLIAKLDWLYLGTVWLPSSSVKVFPIGYSRLSPRTGDKSSGPINCVCSNKIHWFRFFGLVGGSD
jgi:hypothetical protein